MIGPYGCGKTWAGILWAMQHSAINAGLRGLWVEPTFGMIKDILIPELEQFLEAAGFIPCMNARRPLRVDEYILTKSGRPDLVLPIGRWLLRSAEIPAHLKGPTVAWALVDEADLISKEAEDIIQSRVRDPAADLLAIGHVGTPESFGSWLHERCEGEDSQEGDCIVRAKPEDVTGLGVEYYERMRDSYDPQTFEQYAKGRWMLKTEGVIYGLPEENVRPCPFTPGQPVYIGMDFNTAHPFSFVCGHEVNGALELFRQYRLPIGSNTDQAAQVVLEDFKGCPIVIHCDAAGGQRRTSGVAGTDIKILQNAGLEVHWRNVPRKADVYNSTRAMICNAAGGRRLFVDPSCKQLIRELRTLTHDEASKAGADNHSTDALGYLTWGRYNLVWRTQAPGSEEAILSLRARLSGRYS